MYSLANAYVLLVLLLSIGNVGLVFGLVYLNRKSGEAATTWNMVTNGLVILFAILTLAFYLYYGSSKMALWILALVLQYILYWILGLRLRTPRPKNDSVSSNEN